MNDQPRSFLTLVALLSLGLVPGTMRRASAQQPTAVAPSSIQVESQKGRDEAEEDAVRYGHLAKIDAAQAVTAARTRVPGKALRAELENDNGHLVYSVVVAPEQGEAQEVKVDPGTGAILAVEADDSHEDRDDDED